MMKFYPLLLVPILASSCVRTSAKTTPDTPPLDIPAPPPREVETTEPEPPQPVPLISEPARNTPPRRAPAPREPSAPKPAEPPKQEPPKIEPPIEAPPLIEDPPRPPSTLQTTPATAEGEVERAIRSSLSRANLDLSRIDYRLLNADARTQYDTAKRFISQADDAMRAKNLVFARSLADKAAALAAQLSTR
jgi:hypothetical protein